MPRIAVVVTAAGSSERFGPGKKELAELEGLSVLERSILPFLEIQGLEALVVTSPPGREAELRSALSEPCLAALEAIGPGRFALVAGGSIRRDSVRLGLERIAAMYGSPPKADLDEIVALVHDGARPWLGADLASRVASAAEAKGAVVPVVPLVDTPKELGPDGMVISHPPRSSFGGAQTPQGFRLGSLLEAHRRAAAEDYACTDDAELWDHYVGPVASVEGQRENRKLTFARDLREPSRDESRYVESRCDEARCEGPRVRIPRVGQGWDLHRLVPGRPLMLGGIRVPSELGEEAHSDGDVLLHAIIDSILGAAALGDIGAHFPPSDESWRGSDSRDLARRALALVRDAGWEIGNLDCTIVLERPKLGPYKEIMRESVAECLGIERRAVSVKAKTKEGVDATGEVRAVEAYSTAILFPLG